MYCYKEVTPYIAIAIQIILEFLSLKNFIWVERLDLGPSVITTTITRSLIIFKKPRNITNDFFNYYIFVHTFQWTLSKC